MHVYKRGYEKGIKEIKRDVLVLRFVNKTKTSLLRKYAERLEGANKYIDAADLRQPLKLYINHHFGKISEPLSDAIYLKNQLKVLSEQDSLLNTSELCDYFLKLLSYREREWSQEIKKRENELKKIKVRMSALTNTLEKHRSNISNLPGLINSIIEDFLVQSDKEKSQERSINRVMSRPVSNKAEVLITAGPTDEELDGERFFIQDFTTEFYGRLDDDGRKEMVYRLMSNKLLLFSFREFLLRKLDPSDLSNPQIITAARTRFKSTLNQPSSRSAHPDSHNHSVSRASRHSESKSNRSLNRTIGPLPNLSKHDSITSKREDARLNRTDLPIRTTKTHIRVDSDEPLVMNVLGKRRILRYMLRKEGIV